MSPALQAALKKALVAALAAAGLTVFLREHSQAQEREERERKAAATR